LAKLFDPVLDGLRSLDMMLMATTTKAAKPTGLCIFSFQIQILHQAWHTFPIMMVEAAHTLETVSCKLA
jgi:hypothetical protein